MMSLLFTGNMWLSRLFSKPDTHKKKWTCVTMGVDNVTNIKHHPKFNK